MSLTGVSNHSNSREIIERQAEGWLGDLQLLMLFLIESVFFVNQTL